MKKRKSIKTKVFTILLVMQVPLILLVLFFNIYFVNYYNQKISESNRDAMNSYCSVLEDYLKRMDNYMLNFVATNKDFKMLARDTTELDAHLDSLEVMNECLPMLEEDDLLQLCYVVNHPNDIFRPVLSENRYALDVRENLKIYFENYTKDNGTIMNTQWKGMSVGGENFLYMIKGYSGTYLIYILDVSKIHKPQYEQNTERYGEMVFYTENGLILNEKDTIAEQGILFSGDDNYYFSGSKQRYMVTEKDITLANIRAAYIVKSNGGLGNMSWLQRCVIVFSIILVVMILPLGYHLLKKAFFSPLDALVDTMDKIKAGQWEARADENYDETEFLEVNDTFNSMMEEIKSLKIEGYEKELSLQQTKLDYYQIQIRPHFYVNCLKNMYSLLEEKQYDDVKKSIIYLSKHLRYMLKGSSMIVPLEEELQYVQNYIELQQIGRIEPILCKVEADENVLNYSIPAISILSFVENSVKYGLVLNEELKIIIQIQKMMTGEDEYLNIHISDNGSGFSDEVLEHLNQNIETRKDGTTIGIYNVIERFKLYYGAENIECAFSNLNGAHTDIFIKKRKDDSR